MGSHNSTPKTAEIHNPHPRATTIEISQPVLQRLELAKMKANGELPIPTKQCKNCEHCVGQRKPEANEKTKPINNSKSRPANKTLLQKRSFELEELQFEKTLKHLDKVLGKPIQWADCLKAEIDNMRLKIIDCYAVSGREPLRCANEVNKFNDFVMAKQYEAILEN